MSKLFDPLTEAAEAEYAVFIGYDPLEDSAAKMLAWSIRKYNSIHNLKIFPVVRDYLLVYGQCERPVDPNGSTQFSITRFMVPVLMNYTGKAIFFDCDMLITRDIKEMFSYHDPRKAISCVQHDYTPKSAVKMGGKQQTVYPRKNWSSAVLWNCEHPSNKKIDQNTVEEAWPAYLHRFQWLHDYEIGQLPTEFNWLVGEYEKTTSLPFNLHHTLGPPIWPGQENTDWADYWREVFQDCFGRPFDKDKDMIKK